MTYSLKESYLDVVGAGQELIRKGAPVLPALKSNLVCVCVPLSVSSSYGRGGANSDNRL